MSTDMRDEQKARDKIVRSPRWSQKLSGFLTHCASRDLQHVNHRLLAFVWFSLPRAYFDHTDHDEHDPKDEEAQQQKGGQLQASIGQ